MQATVEWGTHFRGTWNPQPFKSTLLLEAALGSLPVIQSKCSEERQLRLLKTCDPMLEVVLCSK